MVHAHRRGDLVPYGHSWVLILGGITMPDYQWNQPPSVCFYKVLTIDGRVTQVWLRELESRKICYNSTFDVSP